MGKNRRNKDKTALKDPMAAFGELVGQGNADEAIKVAATSKLEEDELVQKIGAGVSVLYSKHSAEQRENAARILIRAHRKQTEILPFEKVLQQAEGLPPPAAPELVAPPTTAIMAVPESEAPAPTAPSSRNVNPFDDVASVDVPISDPGSVVQPPAEIPLAPEPPRVNPFNAVGPTNVVLTSQVEDVTPPQVEPPPVPPLSDPMLVMMSADVTFTDPGAGTPPPPVSAPTHREQAWAELKASLQDPEAEIRAAENALKEARAKQRVQLIVLLDRARAEEQYEICLEILRLDPELTEEFAQQLFEALVKQERYPFIKELLELPGWKIQAKEFDGLAEHLPTDLWNLDYLLQLLLKDGVSAGYRKAFVAKLEVGRSMRALADHLVNPHTPGWHEILRMGLQTEADIHIRRTTKPDPTVDDRLKEADELMVALQQKAPARHVPNRSDAGQLTWRQKISLFFDTLTRSF